MSVRKKILGGFVIIFFIGLSLGIVGLLSIVSISNESADRNELQSASEGVSSILNAHNVWRQGITQAVLFGTPFTGSLDPNTCALGKWKESDDAKNVVDAEILSALQKINTPHNFIHTEARRVADLLDAGEPEEAARVLQTDILPATEETISILNSMNERYLVLLNEKSELLTALENTMKYIIIGLLVVALAASVLLALTITSSVMKPIAAMARAAETISTGDLNVHISHPVNDEIGQLAGAFQKMLDATKEQVSAAVLLSEGDLSAIITPRSDKDAMNIALKKVMENLNTMFHNIQDSATRVSDGSKQLADGSHTIAQGSTEQSAAVEQLSSSIEEIAEKTKENASLSDTAARLALSIKQNAEKGSQQMSEMTAAVQEINDASQNISKVIKAIDDIAFQTNILALNASVEAARAGQHGKGFAIVAGEVRNLAAKSAEAARNTGSLIANSIEKAELGVKIADETASSLSDIVDGINESSRLVGSIAQLSGEQAAGIAQINMGIDQVAQAVQQNSAAAEESASASEDMSGQANVLQSLLAQFKLQEGSAVKHIGSGSGGHGVHNDW